jgi:hypothetical protein
MPYPNKTQIRIRIQEKECRNIENKSIEKVMSGEFLPNLPPPSPNDALF